MPIQIEGGVKKLTDTSYLYVVNKVDGEQVWVFNTTLTPQIGDIIEDNGTLTRPDVPPSNQDKSRWIKDQPEVWGRNQDVE